MWTGHRPLWRGSKTGLTSSPVEAQSPCVREESPDFRHGEYVKRDVSRKDVVAVTFDITSCFMDQRTGAISVSAPNIQAIYDDYDLDIAEENNPYKDRPIDRLVITRCPDLSLHYSV